MLTVLRPFLARLLAIGVAFVCTWLTAHYAITIDGTTQHEIVDELLGLIAEFMTIYVGTHRLASKRLNPGDAASSHLATKEKTEVAQMKAIEQSAK